MTFAEITAARVPAGLRVEPAELGADTGDPWCRRVDDASARTR
ncbi:hypothetical protein [uncultured Jatrophihabitans sp.]